MISGGSSSVTTSTWKKIRICCVYFIPFKCQEIYTSQCTVLLSLVTVQSIIKIISRAIIWWFNRFLYIDDATAGLLTYLFAICAVPCLNSWSGIWSFLDRWCHIDCVFLEARSRQSYDYMQTRLCEYYSWVYNITTTTFPPLPIFPYLV